MDGSYLPWQVGGKYGRFLLALSCRHFSGMDILSSLSKNNSGSNLLHSQDTKLQNSRLPPVTLSIFLY
jgi:hypothetical protein